MRNPFSDITLSCNIPSKFIVEQCDDEFVINVFLDTKLIYSTTLQGVKNVSYLYDLDIIVSEYMRNNGLAMVQLSVEAEFIGSVDKAETTVIYSDLRTDVEDDEEFLREHYLTSRTFFLMPKENTESVSFFSRSSENAPFGSIEAVCLYSDGSVQTINASHLLTYVAKDKIYSFNIDYQDLMNRFKKTNASDPVSILSATYRHGQREITAFFTDLQPKACLIFYNAFNCPEKAFIYGTVTHGTEVTQKEAVVRRSTSFYARTSEQRFKVETVSLSLEEALWLNQLFVSSKVIYEIPSSGNQVFVLIDDVNSEIAPDTTEPIRQKFSYRFTDNATYFPQP